MTKEKRTYSKKGGFRNSHPEKAVSDIDRTFDKSIKQIAKVISEHYTKHDGERSSRFFIIVSGGVKRERQYFSLLINKQTEFGRVKVEFVTKDGEGLTALKLYDAAMKIKSKIKNTSVLITYLVYYILSGLPVYVHSNGFALVLL